MFNLETAIAEWRTQMLAAGIQSPALEELESHLREEMEQQLRVHSNEAAAFQAAVAAVGQPGELKQEFRKAGGFLAWLGDNETARIHRVLGGLWLINCLWLTISLSTPIISMLISPAAIGVNLTLILALVLIVIYLRGIIASALLLRGNINQVRIIKQIAWLGLVGMVAQLVVFRSVSVMGTLFTSLNLASLWLLRNRRDDTEKPAAN